MNYESSCVQNHHKLKKYSHKRQRRWRKVVINFTLKKNTKSDHVMFFSKPNKNTGWLDGCIDGSSSSSSSWMEKNENGPGILPKFYPCMCIFFISFQLFFLFLFRPHMFFSCSELKKINKIKWIFAVNNNKKKC